MSTSRFFLVKLYQFHERDACLWCEYKMIREWRYGLSHDLAGACTYFGILWENIFSSFNIILGIICLWCRLCNTHSLFSSVVFVVVVVHKTSMNAFYLSFIQFKWMQVTKNYWIVYFWNFVIVLYFIMRITKTEKKFLFYSRKWSLGILIDRIIYVSKKKNFLKEQKLKRNTFQ